MNTIEKIKSFILDQYGENLVSLYAYGTLDFLLVVKSGDIEPFRRHGAKSKAIKDPVQFSIFTQKELVNAIDVFPIEFLEMKQTKELLYGPDLLADVTVQLTNLRHECEYTLRSNILKLRGALLLPKVDFTALVAESLPVFLSTFSCIFTLKDQVSPVGREACLSALSTLTGVDLVAFTEVVQKKKVEAADFQVYIDALSLITFYVNEL